MSRCLRGTCLFAWGVVGDIELMEGKRQAALEAFERAVDLSAYVGMDHVKRTHMRVFLQQYDKAETELARLRQSGLKGHWYVDHVQGLLDFYRGKYPEAVENFTHAVNKWPISTESKVYAAIAQARLGRFEEALSQARQVSRDLAGSLQSKRLLGSVLVSMGDYQGAREVLQELEQQDPENLYVLQLLATVNLYEGSMPEAQGYASEHCVVTGL